MSVRPLDIAVTVQRTPEVNRNQTNEGIKPEILGQQTADTIKKEVRMQDQNVMQSNKTEENNVSRDGKGNSGYGKGSGRKRRNRDKEKEQQQNKNSGMLDISI